MTARLGSIDRTPQRLAAVEGRHRHATAQRIRLDRSAVMTWLRAAGPAAARLEAHRIGYGQDSARMLVAQLQRELNEERD